jgi:hypothetical protein
LRALVHMGTPTRYIMAGKLRKHCVDMSAWGRCSLSATYHGKEELGSAARLAVLDHDGDGQT